MSGLHFDSQKTKQQGKPDAGKPHVRFDEGEGSQRSLPLCSHPVASLPTLPVMILVRQHRQPNQ